MTDVKATATRPQATSPIRSAKPVKHTSDPAFEVCADRPSVIVTARGINVPPLREHRPLTAAVLKTADTGGSVRVAYVKAEHNRLMSRFKGIELRAKTLVFKYSFELGADQRPAHVRYFCERKPAPAPPQGSEPSVGRDVE